MANFGTLKLQDLKAELKKRGAKTTGRKKELVERLQAYERNFNFSYGNEEVEETIEMELPSSTEYQDINAETPIPCITLEDVEFFLKRFYIPAIPDNAIQMYFNNYLTLIRACTNERGTFVHAVCKAEMKKHVNYNVDLRLNTEGEILETQCECAAGKGPYSSCKNVVVLMLGLVEFGKSGSIKRARTRTEILQSFNKPSKEYTGPAIPAEELPLKRYKADGTGTCPDRKSVIFDPRPEKFRNVNGYNDMVRNICINFAYEQTTFPLLQMYLPANVHAVENDHDYLPMSLSDNCLRNLKVEGNVSKVYIKEIEYSTRSQAECKLWHTERRIRITASHFADICKATERRDLHKLALQIISPSAIHSKAVLHGRRQEKYAIARYEEVTDKSVAKCGLFIHPDKPHLAATPDGLIDLGNGDKYIIEVKCPFASRQELVNPSTVPYLEHEDGALKLKSSSNYYYQIQGQMLVLDCQNCDLIIYTFKDFKIISVQRNDAFLKSMTECLDRFYNCYFRNVLKEKFFYLTCH